MVLQVDGRRAGPGPGHQQGVLQVQHPGAGAGPAHRGRHQVLREVLPHRQHQG